MHRQRAAIKRYHNEFATPLNPLDGSPRKLAGQGPAVPRRYETRGEAGRQDASAGQMWRERAHHGFDFWKFRQSRSLDAHHAARQPAVRRFSTRTTLRCALHIHPDLAVYNFHGKLGELYLFIEV